MQSEHICMKRDSSNLCLGKKQRNGGNNRTTHLVHIGMMILVVFSALTFLQTAEAG